MLLFRIISSPDDSRFNSLVSLIREFDEGRFSEVDAHTSQLMGRGMRFGVACQDGTVVGYTLFKESPRRGNRLMIETLQTYVRKSNRKEKVATKLTHFLASYARSRGITLVYRHNQSVSMSELAVEMSMRPRVFTVGRLKRRWSERIRTLFNPHTTMSNVVMHVRKNH